MSSEKLPHELLLSIVRGEAIDGRTPTLDERIRAAAIAAPYFAPRLASIAHQGADGGPVVVRIVKFGDKSETAKPK